jgi:hypothetical protein
MKLVLENQDGKVARTFVVDGESGVVISRHKTRRLEIHPNLEVLNASKVKFDEIGVITRAELENEPLKVAHGARIRLADTVGDIVTNEKLERDSEKLWYASLAVLFALNALFLTVLFNRPVETAKLEQELKQQVVQIVKRIPVKQQEVPQQANTQNKTVDNQTVKTTQNRTNAIKRMGALAVFGSLKNGSQRGGVNLGAVNTTAGPGLGGTGGSGGVQTTLYGKGLVAAPLGAGSNMQGGGGYGTKGKGGGQAGYGKLSLVGSAGGNPIPLGKEAIIAGGLDRDLIADVINRNLGQVRFCYEQGLQGDPGLGGRVAVGFVIGGNGQVKVAGIESTTLNSKIVEDCILLRLKSWKFPLPEGGVDVKVSYPFVLRRTGQG